MCLLFDELRYLYFGNDLEKKVVRNLNYIDRFNFLGIIF